MGARSPPLFSAAWTNKFAVLCVILYTFKTNELVRSLDDSFSASLFRQHMEVQRECSALELFLWSKIAIVTTLSLSAVSRLWWQSGITFTADHLFAFILSGKLGKCWFDLDFTVTTTSKSEN
tara:strand:+ start:169 stop:534 length:366 start_codon:yes stop_codon:yes gene_type:complete